MVTRSIGGTCDLCVTSTPTLFHSLAIATLTAPSWGADDAASEGVIVKGDDESADDETETSASLTVIHLDDRLPISGDVADALETTTGVRINRLGGIAGWSTVSIRGASSRQVAVYLDGIPLNPDGAAALNLSELPATAFDRIEVYRSNPPPQFGAAPMGGVVNMRTPRDPNALGASATVGQYNTHRASAFGAGSARVRNTTVDAWAAAEHLGTEGDFSFFQNRSTVFNLFDDSFERRQNNDKRQLNLLGRIRIGSDRGTASVLHSALTRKEGIPGPANAQSTGTRLETTRMLTALDAHTDGSWGRSRLTGWRIGTDELWDNRGGEVGVGTQWEDQTTDMLGAQSTTELALTARIIAILAGSIRGDRFERTDRLANRTDEPRTRTVWSASPGIRTQWFDDRIQLDGTAFIQGIHNDAFGDQAFDAVPDALRATDTDLIAAKPRAGLLARVGRRSVIKASWGQALRPPDFTELFGNRGSIIGNPSLLPESSTTIDLGGRTQVNASGLDAVVEVAAFRTTSTNKIVFVQNSQRTVKPINVQGARIHGFEAALTLGAFDAVQSRTSATRNWSENRSDAAAYSGNQLPGVPNLEVWQQTSVGWRERVRVGHTYSFTDGEYWDQTNWYQAAPRHLHSAFVRMTPVARGPELEFETRNLTNRMVEQVDRDPLNPDDNAVVVKGIDDFHGYPLPGRTWLISLRWSA